MAFSYICHCFKSNIEILVPRERNLHGSNLRLLQLKARTEAAVDNFNPSKTKTNMGY